MQVNYCIVSIALLRNSPYNLVRLDLIQAEVRAHNVRGWSLYSDFNTIGTTVGTEPDQMTLPTNGVLSDEYMIDVLWDPLTYPANGNSPITSYNLEYDNANGGFMWYSLVGFHPDSTTLTYRITTGLVPGRTYMFRVSGRNAYGWGDASSFIYIKAATTPDQMISPVTSIDSATGMMRISWISPYNGGDTITLYTI